MWMPGRGTYTDLYSYSIHAPRQLIQFHRQRQRGQPNPKPLIGDFSSKFSKRKMFKVFMKLMEL